MRMILFGAATLGLTLGAVAPASALSMKECSAKYQSAKQAGNTAKWKDFRKTECSVDASPAAPAGTSAPAQLLRRPPSPAPSLCRL